MEILPLWYNLAARYGTVHAIFLHLVWTLCKNGLPRERERERCIQYIEYIPSIINNGDVTQAFGRIQTISLSKIIKIDR